MTEHRRKVGVITILMGILVCVSGASLVFDFIAEGDRWEVALKGPVWIVLGACLVLIGREFAND